jgi:hypothetical protein
MGFIVGHEMTTFLDSIQGCGHMHLHGFLGPGIIPQRKVESGVLVNQCLKLNILHLEDFFLDLILLGHIGNRRWLT